MTTNFKGAATTAICLGLTTSCLTQGAGTEGTACLPNTRAVYEQPEVNVGAGGEAFEEHTWRSFTVAKRDEGSGAALADCTTDTFLCVTKSVDGAVFAVPRGPLSEGSTFEIAGSRITYLGCFSSGRAKCDRKVFVAYWGNPLSDSLRKSLRAPNGRLPSAEETRERQTYVIDALRGVVSYAVLQRGMPSAAFKAQEWEQFNFSKSNFMLLKSGIGLLACKAKPAH
jgi:hypothetical protein